ncbi:cathepsin l 1 [Anaeramoeba ignava]|uniref:Cathepsin l 1 n=1 Tax=Anaeramoeba ignava TaxID=1746090 RepID=A0A9Q0RC62_ANAIG|nr:cathepsin l 1 [Anaeramoeba ignava]
MSYEEFAATYLMEPTFHDNYHFEQITLEESEKLGSSEMPNDLDWRWSHCTPIKSQSSCGSCWTFGAMAGIEGALSSQKGLLLQLSEQELLSCTYNNTLSSNPAFNDGYIDTPLYWDNWYNGCSGGNVGHVYQMLAIYQVPIASMKQYPYQNADQLCQKTGFSTMAKMSSQEQSGSYWGEDVLKQLLQNGPVSASVYVDYNFQNYQSGVFKSKNCYVSGKTNHAIAIVGYISNYQGEAVWILRNSWGTGWGASGYMYIAKDVSSYDGQSYPYGMCNVGIQLRQPQKNFTNTVSALGSIQNFTCSKTDNSWACTWDQISGVTSYDVYHSSDGHPWTAVNTSVTCTTSICSYNQTEDPSNVIVAVRGRKSLTSYYLWGETTPWKWYNIVSDATSLMFGLSLLLLAFFL